MSHQVDFSDVKSDPPSYHMSLSSDDVRPLQPQEAAEGWFTKWFIEWWMFEILCLIFCFLCMSTIIAVLLYYNGREYSTWEGVISIDAFVALFSGFAKSALLVPTAEALGQLKWDWYRDKPRSLSDFERLDNASRGVWGSLMLLARSRKITLASVGAAIILLTLPLDAFFQQIVNVSSELVLSANNATTGRAVYYNPDGAAQVWNGTTTYRADWTMENAVIGNFYNRPWSTEVDYVCPTKNCTWDPFYSLAVEGSCQQLPNDFLELGCHEVSGQWLSDVIPDPTQPDNVIPNITTCGWYLNPPDAPQELMTGYVLNNDSNYGQALTTRLFPLRDQFTRAAIYNGSINFDSRALSTIQDFLIAATPAGADGAYKNSTPVVHECELHWVAQLLRSKVTDGVLSEEVIAAQDLDADPTGPITANSPWLSLRSYGLNFTRILQDSETSSSTLFGMSNLTARRTIQALEEIVPASVTVADLNAVPVAKTFWRGAQPDPRALPDALNPWLPPMNATEYINRIARAMTIAARRTGNVDDPQHDTVFGEAWDERRIIRVKWAFVALPLMLLIAAFMFLGGTILRSSDQESALGVWKTSVLPVLFNGLGQDVQDQPGAHDRLGQAKAKAKKLNVTLGR